MLLFDYLGCMIVRLVCKNGKILYNDNLCKKIDGIERNIRKIYIKISNNMKCGFKIELIQYIMFTDEHIIL